MLRAAFVRTLGQPDRIHVIRSDGSEVSWPFPTFGDDLPHDLVHLVVESAFGLTGGFWGRVDAGADPKRINDEANRRGGADKYAAFGADRRELDLAEVLAAASWSVDTVEEEVRASCGKLGVEPPPELSKERVRETRAVLARLATRWRGLQPKGALNVAFDRDRPRASFEETLLVELTRA